MKIKTVVLMSIVVLCLIVLFQNTEMVTLRFLFWDFSLPQIFLIPIVLVIGFPLGYLVFRLQVDLGGDV